VTHPSKLPRYVTTALPYVNARPHLGFALEAVIADALARHARQRGRPVRFVSGTDEHSLKNVLAAERAGRPVEDLVAEHAAAFRALGAGLGLHLEDFIRTSTDPRHRAAVEAVWRACAQQGDLYRRSYRGLYCIGCEAFFDPADLVDGVCPEHGAAPETIEEENWFFRLSRYREAVLDVILTGRLSVEPVSAREEAIAFLRGPVHDISVSRSASRARGFGIPVPGDPTQVVYVWLDALVGYLATLGFPGDDPHYHRFWAGSGDRVHVIGKGINRFHTVFWPALLTSAGLPLPTHVLVHGYLTINGRKISKTGPWVDPTPLLAEHCADALRYYLLRHIRTTKDGDFRLDRFVRAHDAELANQLGNLVSRVLALLEKYTGGRVPAPEALDETDAALAALLVALPGRVDGAVARFALDEALDAIFAAVEAANLYVERTAPWSLAAQARTARLGTVLYGLAQTVAVIGEELAPFLPGTAATIRESFGLLAPGTAVLRGTVLFPKKTGRRVR
jgi:methionyl-tRNA synthetase